MNEVFNFYRIKTEWTAEQSDGGLCKTKAEELVSAVNYTDAERLANEIAEDQCRGQYGSFSIEIIRTKISEILYSDNLVRSPQLIAGMIYNYFEEPEDTGMGMYAVRVMFIDVNEKSGKEKRTNETFYTPASSNTDAAAFVESFIHRSCDGRDFIVRDTKFDKAEAILWSSDLHQSKVGQFELG